MRGYSIMAKAYADATATIPAKASKHHKASINGKGLTAATYSSGGKKGKPSMPEGMSHEEWWKVTVNARVPKILKGMRGIARLASMKGFDPDIASRIEADLKAHIAMVREAFGNPKPKKVIKTESRYVI